MIFELMEEYRVTKSDCIFEKIKENAENKKALAFLFSVKEEEYKDAMLAVAQEILSLSRDEDGLFVKDGVAQEELLYEVMPVYALYSTRLNKKDYIDLMKQCRQAVKKYPASEKIFAMLAEVLEYVSEEIFEHYKALQTLLWQQYEAVKAQDTELVAYALAKGCFYKAFLLEKYEERFVPYLSGSKNSAYYAVKRLEQRFDRV